MATATRTAAARELRVRVGRRVDGVTRGMVQSWAAAWQLVRDDLVRAVADAEAAAALTGRLDSPAAYRSARLHASLDELSEQLRQLGMRAGVTVRNATPGIVRIPPQVLAELGRLEGVTFNLPAGDALERIVRRTQQGIASSYLQLTVDAERALRDSLVRGVAAGTGPRTVARDMLTRARATAAARHGLTAEMEAAVLAGGRGPGVLGAAQDAFAGGMTRALTLARTELIDCSREATTEVYLRNGGLVTGWVWVATLTARTCPACWSLHGTVWPPEQHQEGHQQCRCTQIPQLATDDQGDADVGDPAAAFRRLPRAEQLQVMGPRRLQWLDDGGEFRALAQTRDNPGWRRGHYVRPADQLPIGPGNMPADMPRPVDVGPAGTWTATPDPLGGRALAGMSDDDLADLLADPGIGADAAKLDRVVAELERRDEFALQATAAAKPASLRTPAERAAVERFYRAQEAADAAARAARLTAEQANPQRRRGTALQQLRADFELFTHNAYLQAEDATAGNMLSRAGQAAGVDPYTLMYGNSARARKYASEELQRWWAQHGRVTFEQFRADAAGRTGEARRLRQRASGGQF